MDLEHRDVGSDLGRIRVRVGGNRTGPTIVFWPSLLMDATMWRAQAEHFAPNHRVVLVDPPGHGHSERLHGPFRFDDCARVIVRILDSLDLRRVHFVGNSWGAMIGVTFAANYPNRVDHVVLMNGTANPAGRRQKLDYGLLVAAVRAVGFRGPLLNTAVNAFLGPTSLRGRPDVVAKVRASIRDVDIPSVSHAVRSIVPRRPDQRPLLARITAPVLVIAGREDATFPLAETREVADGITGNGRGPHASFVVLDDAAHLAALEVPARVNTLIKDFLGPPPSRGNDGVEPQRD